MPDLFPTDQNDSIAATDAPLPPGSPLQPPTPRPPMGPPPDPMQQIMGMLGQPQPQSPTPPPPLGNQQPPIPGAQPGPSPIPGVASIDGSGSDPIQTARQKLQQQMQQTKQEQEDVRAKIKALMNPDAINAQLPGGGKVKPSDLLRDAMYNFSQLNLRNPVYGSLRGQDYKPIQQQRFEQALSQHNAQLQNLTLMDKSLNEQMQSYQYQENQTRQEQQERDKVNNQSQVLALNEKKLAQKTVQDEAGNKLKSLLANSNVDLKLSQKERNDQITDNLKAFGGNKANFEQWYVLNHSSDPDFTDKWIQIHKAVNEKPIDYSNPNRQIASIMLGAMQGAQGDGAEKYVNTTSGGTGRFGDYQPPTTYLDASKLDPKIKTVLVADATKKGIPIIYDTKIAEGLKDVDSVKDSISRIWDHVYPLLPKDPMERATSGIMNAKVGKVFQTEPEYGAFLQNINVAIQSLKALTSGAGASLRITQPEIDREQQAFIKPDDTIATAQEKMNHLFSFLDQKQKAALIRDRSSAAFSTTSIAGAQGGGIAYTPPATKEANPKQKPAGVAPPPTAEKPRKRLDELFKPPKE